MGTTADARASGRGEEGRARKKGKGGTGEDDYKMERGGQRDSEHGSKPKKRGKVKRCRIDHMVVPLADLNLT